MSANQRTKCSASFSRAGRSVTFSPRSNGPNMEAARIAADAAFLPGWRDDLARESDAGLTMRFLVAAGFAILIAATAKAIDVLLTPFGATFDPGLQLPYALSGYVLYRLGLALLFIALAAHFGFAAASPRLIRSGAALAAVALLFGHRNRGLCAVVSRDGATVDHPRRAAAVCRRPRHQHSAPRRRRFAPDLAGVSIVVAQATGRCVRAAESSTSSPRRSPTSSLARIRVR